MSKIPAWRKICPECGLDRINQNIKGRIFPYKDANIPYPADDYFLCCPKCGDFTVNSKDTQRFDEVLEPEYQKQQPQKGGSDA